jgi:hypothetical protein
MAGVGGVNEVVLFVGIRLEVVEFFLVGVADAVFAVEEDGCDRAAGVRVPGRVIYAPADEGELGAGGEGSIRAGSDGGGEGIAGDAARRDFEQVEDGGGEIAEGDHLADALSGDGAVGGDDEKRDMESGAVEAVGMLDDVVFAELFAVVADDDDDCVLEVPAVFEVLEEFVDAAVESAEAVFVGIAGEGKMRGVGVGLRGHEAIYAPEEDLALLVRGSGLVPGFGLVGNVTVAIVQEGEERAFG